MNSLPLRRPLSVYARVLTLLCHLLLLAGLAWWSSTKLGYLMTALLLLPLPGLLRGREYTYAWASLMLTFWCAGLLAEGVAVPANRSAALVFASLAAVEFSALVLFVRFRARERVAQMAASGAASH